jgi:hypothetical protein
MIIKKDINDNTVWNKNELLQASLIIIHYHKLSLIVESLKINLIENDSQKDLKIEENFKNNPDIKKKIITDLKDIENDIESDIFGNCIIYK